MNIKERVDSFRAENVVPTPNTLDSLRFACCEAAEIMDAQLRSNLEYIRGSEKQPDILLECGQCAMMILTAMEDWDEVDYKARKYHPFSDDVAMILGYCADALIDYQGGEKNSWWFVANELSEALVVIEKVCLDYGSSMDVEVDRAIENLRGRRR